MIGDNQLFNIPRLIDKNKGPRLLAGKKISRVWNLLKPKRETRATKPKPRKNVDKKFSETIFFSAASFGEIPVKGQVDFSRV